MYQNKITFIYSLLALLTLIFTGCSHTSHKNMSIESASHAEAHIEAKSGNKTIKGDVHFMFQEEMLTAKGTIEGLKPNTNHGFHIHEKGDCTANDASSAGGHFSPNAGNKHGSHSDPNRHAGDMGNLTSDKNGVATFSISLPGLNLSSKDKTYSVLDRAVVVHADPDDFVTQPSGNSGARIGCGIIK